MGAPARMGGDVPARRVKPSGRSLEPGSNARPRGMAVTREQFRGQNSAYRSGCYNFYFQQLGSFRAICDARVADSNRLSLPRKLQSSYFKTMCTRRSDPRITSAWPTTDQSNCRSPEVCPLGG